MRARLKPGDMGNGSADLRGFKVASVALRENELRISLRSRTASWTMTLRGIIAFKDSGVAGKALEGYAIEDMGSFKAIRFLHSVKDGGPLFRCEYLEGLIEPDGPA